MSIGGIDQNSRMYSTQMAQRRFQRADTNGDKSIDKDEFGDFANKISKKMGISGGIDTEKMFAKLDTDGDGSISASEQAKMQKKGMQSMGTSGGMRGIGSNKQDMFNNLMEILNASSDDEEDAEENLQEFLDTQKKQYDYGAYSEKGGNKNSISDSILVDYFA